MSKVRSSKVCNALRGFLWENLFQQSKRINGGNMTCLLIMNVLEPKILQYNCLEGQCLRKWLLLGFSVEPVTCNTCHGCTGKCYGYQSASTSRSIGLVLISVYACNYHSNGWTSIENPGHHGQHREMKSSFSWW